MINLLAPLTLLLFVLSLFLRWFKNYATAEGPSDLPFILRSSTNLTAFLILTFVLTYGSIIGVGYFYGIWAGVGAFLLRAIVGLVSRTHFFRRSLRQHAEYEYRQLLKERATTGSPATKTPFEMALDGLRGNIASSPDLTSMDDAQLREEAYRRAREFMQNRNRVLHSRI